MQIKKSANVTGSTKHYDILRCSKGTFISKEKSCIVGLPLQFFSWPVNSCSLIKGDSHQVGRLPVDSQFKVGNKVKLLLVKIYTLFLAILPFL